MENKKMKRIPFDLELAKAITAGEKEGRVVTNLGLPARIVCWDRDNYYYPIVALLREENALSENVYGFTADGKSFVDKDNPGQLLLLEVPDEQEFKLGDVVTSDIGSATSISIFRAISENNLLSSYADMDIEDRHCYFSNQCGYFDEIRLATPEERQLLIDALKKDGSDKAREYLKRFFNITLPYKFEPFDKVLVRDNWSERWRIGFYSHTEEGKEYPFICSCSHYHYCIPYNEQTKHLLGTTEDCEE